MDCPVHSNYLRNSRVWTAQKIKRIQEIKQSRILLRLRSCGEVYEESVLGRRTKNSPSPALGELKAQHRKKPFRISTFRSAPSSPRYSPRKQSPVLSPSHEHQFAHIIAEALEQQQHCKQLRSQLRRLIL